jgi:hypothetical protein
MPPSFGGLGSGFGQPQQPPQALQAIAALQVGGCAALFECVIE